MVLNITECKMLLNISTAITTYDAQIETLIPFVQDDICAIANHRFHDAYHWLKDDGLFFSSTAKTVQLSTDSTCSFYNEYSTGDTIDVDISYKNNGFYTISSITSSHVLVVSESLIDEYSTTYEINTIIHRCDFPGNIKRIAARMVWWNVQNTQVTQGDIASESYGARSVSYRDTGKGSYGLYPASLTAGITKKAGSW
jgi:hypothetical protein